MLLFELLFSFSLFFRFRRLVYQLQELGELRSDDNLRTAVALLAQFGVIIRERIIFSTAGGGKTFGVDAVLILQGLHYG